MDYREMMVAAEWVVVVAGLQTGAEVFQQFRAAYSVTARNSGSAPWQDPLLLTSSGYENLARTAAGCTFDQGLYRFHDASSGPAALRLIEDYFPEASGSFVPFGFDWLGRQFALDRAREVQSECLVVIVEPGTGMVLEVPANFEGFHDEELANDPDACLASPAFWEWASDNRALLPLQFSDCVGYDVPLFLGGVDGPGNFAVTDIDVYWSIFGQLRLAAITKNRSDPQ